MRTGIYVGTIGTGSAPVQDRGPAMMKRKRDMRFVMVLIAIWALPLALTARADEPPSSSHPLQAAATGQPKVAPSVPEGGHVTFEAARPAGGQSVVLAEFPVIGLADRDVRLRLTLRSVPPPPFVNPGVGEVEANANRSALVTMNVGALISRRPQQ
jgi:hypothetical protein